MLNFLNSWRTPTGPASGTVPKLNSSWDEYYARLMRYELYESYYTNTAYTNIQKLSTYYKRNRRLYRNTRAIYNPVFRLVQLYVAKLYGGDIDWDGLETGAIPIVGGDDALRTAIRQLWLSSNWQRKKSLYGRLGAKLGDVCLKVVDEPAQGRVRLEVVHPAKVKYADFDSNGDVLKVVFEYPCIEYRGDPLRNPTQHSYLYSEVITPDAYQTFRDGQPYAYYADASGEKVKEWDNEYGFVPVVLGQHLDEGFKFGATPYHAAVQKIDELNELASLLNDQIFKTITPIWAFIGVAGKDKVNVAPESTGSSTTERDQVRSMYLPDGASNPFPMVANINIVDTLSDIEALLKEIERDMPELVLHRLREGGSLTAPGVRAGFSDASDRIIEARGNYDDYLVKAHKQAIAIGGYRGYRNFEPYALESLTSGDLEHFIGDRPVIVDALSKKEEFDVLRDAEAPIWLTLEKMGYSQETIDRVMAEDEEKRRQEVRGAVESLFGTGDDDEEDADDGEETNLEAGAGTEPE